MLQNRLCQNHAAVMAASTESLGNYLCISSMSDKYSTDCWFMRLCFHHMDHEPRPAGLYSMTAFAPLFIGLPVIGIVDPASHCNRRRKLEKSRRH